MSRFTSEDLMKAMGLQVGDRIKVKFDICSPYYQDTVDCICEIIKNIKGSIMVINSNNQTMFIHNLVDMDYEILPRPKRVGDIMCGELLCKHCPLKMLAGCEEMQGDNTLYECLEECKTIFIDSEIYDDEIYNIIKARLDKEVTENVEN